MSLAFEWETFDFWQPIGFTVVIFGFVMYTTDCVHLCMLKICPMYERFVNKEDQDEIEKTQSEYSKSQKGRLLECASQALKSTFLEKFSISRG